MRIFELMKIINLFYIYVLTLSIDGYLHVRREDMKYGEICVDSIHFLKKWEGGYGVALVDENLTGLSRRVAEAYVRSRFHLSTNCMGDFSPSDDKVRWLRKFGIESSGCKFIDQAYIDDVCEQLDCEVIRYEGLWVGEKVVHVKDKKKVFVIRSVDVGGRVKFEGTGKTAHARMLRRYRPDGDYAKTDIPNEYFWRGWLER